MSSVSPTSERIRKFDPEAYRFVYEALHFTQQKLDRAHAGEESEEAHITGQELAHGARELGIERYGLLAKTVFRQWGIRSTADFGRVVFELIERGEMRKTDRDQLSDFFDVFDFDEALDHDYQIQVPTSG
ncbi:hypothetical protein KOR42_29030 [Thalassoglobus neptunius]|uniref:Verruc_Plancto-restricted protein n=1 Tax=Thalassoglobus neptunius TaxID=1938619 RepID=A0A5C5WX28_9PLAN|nr:Minf_1886 family protein [Thalassoglobus neptunius]TWT55276.1 hypothetical protein KOR42_29030 [Thalassoglobus neptunius]